MRNVKFKRTLGLFIWMFIILFFFSTTFTWINFYQFKSNSEKHQLEMSTLIASDIENRYESVGTFLKTMDPQISKTVEDSLYSIERELEANSKHVDDKVLEALQKEYNLTNIYVLDKDGIVQYSTDKREIGKYSREFNNEEDREKWEKAFNRIVKTQEVYIEDKFYRSEMHPYRYHKWGYKGIGEVDGLGLVVLEVGIQVLDIRDKSITPLVEQVADLEKMNKNVIALDFVNPPPNKTNLNLGENQVLKNNGDIVTKVNIEGIDGAEIQAVVTTHFTITLESIDRAFQNASIWTAFYAIFSFLLCLLLYYRFSIPVRYINEEIINESLKKLKDLK